MDQFDPGLVSSVECSEISLGAKIEALYVVHSDLVGKIKKKILCSYCVHWPTSHPWIY